MVHEPRRGFGAACHAGLLAATADVVVLLRLPTPRWTRPSCPPVAGRASPGEADLVLGRRRPTARSAWPPHARFANRVLAVRLRAPTGVRCTTSGPMRAARREAALLELDLRDRRSGYPLEMVVRAAAPGWRIAEMRRRLPPRERPVQGDRHGARDAAGRAATCGAVLARRAR